MGARVIVPTEPLRRLLSLDATIPTRPEVAPRQEQQAGPSARDHRSERNFAAESPDQWWLSDIAVRV
ncbi:hypothetical protein NGTWS0302_07660 [Mycolicibacterium cyprinidarum]|uniref:Uncharacterized protein n=1 Tax=Mycolicibacterium cyprinidarum TaxID=2860311 RepID=A0ABQ4VCC4_9MYCO|nr:hypothetical protein NGTWS1702_35660 [Mycolicibacterium sp. NGTWSNA01]GJF14820.1 hypothetical protein NGTWS0302_07660 [Mycolicibacterium sp. NGTWS0302]GJF17804.1 hypothetical protein NGTWS1803_36030 [Mycolicibacterium sp. NGTWS1803]